MSYLFLSSSLLAKPLFKNINEKKIIAKYLQDHKVFFRQMCKPGTEEYFWKIYRNFRGSGNFTPLKFSGELDLPTVKKYIPELSRKIRWVRQNKTKLKKSSFGKLQQKLSRLEKNFLKLSKKRERYTKGKLKKSKYLKSLEEFRKRILIFLHELHFLHSYNFPVDHLALRTEYDHYKAGKTPKDKIKANDIYFYRQIVQDGAHDKGSKKSDRFLRANIDSLILRLERKGKTESFSLNENLRYDIEDTLKGIKKFLFKKKKYLLARFDIWEKKVFERRDFYKNLVSSFNENKKSHKLDNFLLAQKESRSILHKYVLRKEAESYEFWTKKEEISRALFSLETILYNEVGLIDGRDALERKDVTRVAINRFFSEKFSHIDEGEYLYPYLVKRINPKVIQEYKWLNLMFKQGEFSFTYFFIPGNVKIYCPDMSRRGKSIRLANLKLILKILKKEKSKFMATRYFSRASMLGRVDMSLLWSEYKKVPNELGLKIKQDRHLRAKKKKGLYEFLYRFGKRDFEVLRISGKKYVRDINKGYFYKYRNPHYFTYFYEPEVL